MTDSDTDPVYTVPLDFPIRPEVRFGYHKPMHDGLRKLISAGDGRYSDILESFARFAGDFGRIAKEGDDPLEPYWRNDWIPSLDAMSLYGLMVTTNPRVYAEIGSGTSTKFVRRAIRDHGLNTKIISVDPYPRSEIDQICDEVVRSPLESADLALFKALAPGDILFCDNSHRCFQNSDVTVFFLDILPHLHPGVIVGLHDIFLPFDYPPNWLKRYYNEQYLLACWLLASSTVQIELPVFFCGTEARFSMPIASLFTAPELMEIPRHGGCFWFRNTSWSTSPNTGILRALGR